MYYYEISWSWNEDYVPTILTNEKCFSDKEFKNIVDRAVKFAFVKLFDSEYKRDPEERLQIGFCRWNEMSKIVLDCIKDHGFEELKVKSHIDYFGMYIVGQNLPKKEYNRLKNICGEELVNKMIGHNEKMGLDRKLFDELDNRK